MNPPTVVKEVNSSFTLNRFRFSQIVTVSFRRGPTHEKKKDARTGRCGAPLIGGPADGGSELQTQINSGLQRKAEVRKGLCDGPDPDAVKPAAFICIDS